MRTLVILSGLLLASAAHATTYRVTPIGSPYVWPTVEANSPKEAFIAAARLFAFIVPSWAAIITAPRVCRSTHRIVGGGVTKYGYDSRFNDNHC